MISWEDFKKHMHEVCLLIGQNPPKEQMQAIYQKVKDFELQDFINACNDDELLEDLAYRKMNYPSLKRAIIKHQIARQERELAIAKRKEAEEIKAMAKNNVELHNAIKMFLQKFEQGGDL